jgi:hypothetical protein
MAPPCRQGKVSPRRLVDNVLTSSSFQIAEKVRTALANLRRVSSSSYGAKLTDLRNLYLTKICPLFSYA